MKLNLISFPCEQLTQLKIPLALSHLSCGFPSAADDFLENNLDLNEFLIKSPAATIFAWAEGDSMKNRGIFNKDLLIIDRSVEKAHGSIVVAAIDGELTCKILDRKKGLLIPANKFNQTIDIKGREDILLEGVVIYSIRSHYE